MGDNIRLHKAKGLNPHLEVCPACGKENGEILLFGSRNKVFTCQNCGTKNYGAHKFSTCGACGNLLNNSEFREIEDNEKIPGRLCDACIAEKKRFDDEVIKGGTYWRCSSCGAHGVFMAGSEVANAVRKESGIEAPMPVGVELDNKSCPACYQRKKLQ